MELVRSEGWEHVRRSLEEAGPVEGSLMSLSPDVPVAEESSTQMTRGREKITREMIADASRLPPEFGIALMDIRIKRIKFVKSVQQKVFERMISERKRIAAHYRSEGEGERAAILGQMKRELARITSEAYRKSQEIRGKADAEAARIYADPFGRDSEFFEFHGTLELYRNFKNPGSAFVLSTDADVFMYLKHDRQGTKQ